MELIELPKIYQARGAGQTITARQFYGMITAMKHTNIYGMQFIIHKPENHKQTQPVKYINGEGVCYK